MDSATREFVRDRATSRCEYCLIREADDEVRFHVEHIVSQKHGGTDDANNLAYSCQNCNLHKGSNLTSVDLESGSDEPVPLFHPRRDVWGNHFRYDGPRIVGLTPIGRATVFCLNMNDAERVELRALLGYTDSFG